MWFLLLFVSLFVCSFALDLSHSRLPQTEEHVPWEGTKKRKMPVQSADKMDNADAGEAGHSAL